PLFCVHYPDSFLLAAFHDHPVYTAGGLAAVCCLLLLLCFQRFSGCASCRNRFVPAFFLRPRVRRDEAGEQRQFSSEQHEKVDTTSPSRDKIGSNQHGKDHCKKELLGISKKAAASSYGTLRGQEVEKTPQLSFPNVAGRKDANPITTSKGPQTTTLHQERRPHYHRHPSTPSNNDNNYNSSVPTPTPTLSSVGSEDMDSELSSPGRTRMKYDPESLEKMAPRTRSGRSSGSFQQDRNSIKTKTQFQGGAKQQEMTSNRNAGEASPLGKSGKSDQLPSGSEEKSSPCNVTAPGKGKRNKNRKKKKAKTKTVMSMTNTGNTVHSDSEVSPPLGAANHV
ncbi:unnamed protein product, partial [Amoebophrya sp. A120]